NGLGLLLVPCAVVTLMNPLVAPDGTWTLTTVKAAFGFASTLALPLNLTPVGATLRCTPLMTIRSLTAPALGNTSVINGPGPTTVKSALLDTLGKELRWTLIGPVTAPAGTWA